MTGSRELHAEQKRRESRASSESHLYQGDACTLTSYRRLRKHFLQNDQTIIKALQQYGMILADNGSSMYRFTVMNGPGEKTRLPEPGGVTVWVRESERLAGLSLAEAKGGSVR